MRKNFQHVLLFGFIAGLLFGCTSPSTSTPTIAQRYEEVRATATEEEFPDPIEQQAFEELPLVTIIPESGNGESIQYLDLVEIGSETKDSDLVIQGRVKSLAISNDNSLLAVCSTEAMGVFSVTDRSTLWLNDHLSDACHRLAFSSDGKYLLFSQSGIDSLLDARTGDRQAFVQYLDYVTFTPGDKYIIGLQSYKEDAFVVMNYELETVFGLPAMEGATHNGMARFSPDGSLITSFIYPNPLGINEPRIIFWDWATREIRGSFAVTDVLLDIRFSRDGQSVFSITTEGMFQQWGLDGALLAEFEDPFTGAAFGGFSDFGEVFAGNFTKDGVKKFMVVRIKDNSVLYESDPIEMFTVSDDGRFLVNGDKELEIIDLQAGGQADTMGAFAPLSGWDGYLVSPQGDRVIFFRRASEQEMEGVMWDLASRTKMSEFSLPAVAVNNSLGFGPGNIQFTHDGQKLIIFDLNASADGIAAYQFDLDSGILSPLENFSSQPHLFSYTVGPQDNPISLPVQLPGWSELPVEEQDQSMVMGHIWSSDHTKLLFAIGPFNLYLWDMNSQALIQKINGQDINISIIYDVYLSNDGEIARLLYNTGPNRYEDIQLMDLLTGETIALPTDEFVNTDPYFLFDGDYLFYQIRGSKVLYPTGGGDPIYLPIRLDDSMKLHLVLNNSTLLGIGRDSMRMWALRRP